LSRFDDNADLTGSRAKERERVSRRSGAGIVGSPRATSSGGPRGRSPPDQQKMRKGGLEPPLDCSNKLLRLARLPIPPLPRGEERSIIATPRGSWELREPSARYG